MKNNMNEDAPVQAPTDIAGVGIHLSYMRRDIKAISQTLNNITTSFVPISQHLELKAEVDTLKKESILITHWMDTWAGKVWGINFTFGAVIAVSIFIYEHFINR